MEKKVKEVFITDIKQNLKCMFCGYMINMESSYVKMMFDCVSLVINTKAAGSVFLKSSLINLLNLLFAQHVCSFVLVLWGHVGQKLFFCSVKTKNVTKC